MTGPIEFGLKARQRAQGEARGAFARVGLRTEAERTFETGGLRWRFPRSTSPCEAVIVNTGGGVAGGDAYRIEVSLKDGAEVEATTTAAEKIYRADGCPASLATLLELAPRSRLFWLPQETILFDGARLERRLDVDIADDAALLVAETIVFGRLAMGESHIEAALRDSWRIRRRNELVFADETRLARAGAALDRRAVGAGARAVSLMLAAAPNIEARLPSLRAALMTEGAEVDAGASAFDGIIVTRLVSASPSRLRAALIASIVALGVRVPRLWR